MTRQLHRILAATLILTMALHAAASVAHAGPPSVRYATAPEGTSVVVEGTSNVHDWDGRTDRIEGWIELPGQWLTSDAGLRLEPALAQLIESGAEDKPKARIEARIPVKSLEGNRRGLAGNMHDAMEADDHPHVTFKLTEVRSVTPRDERTGQWAVRGNLTVAGTRRPVDLDLVIQQSRTGDTLRITIEKDLKMTDFGIDPPRALMGMARAADDVEVAIQWVVRRQTPQPTVAALDIDGEPREAMSTIVVGYDRARRALAEGELDAAREALADFDDAIKTLEALEPGDEHAAQWHQRVSRLAGSVRGMANASSINAARPAFAVLSHSVGQVLDMVAHDRAQSVLAYSYPGQRGVAGAVWLQLDNRDAEPRSPYVDQTPANTATRVHVIYPGNVDGHADANHDE